MTTIHHPETEQAAASRLAALLPDCRTRSFAEKDVAATERTGLLVPLSGGLPTGQAVAFIRRGLGHADLDGLRYLFCLLLDPDGRASRYAPVIIEQELCAIGCLPSYLATIRADDEAACARVAEELRDEAIRIPSRPPFSHLATRILRSRIEA